MEFIGYIPTIEEAILLASASIKGMISTEKERIRTKIYHGKTVIYSVTNSKIRRWTDDKRWSTSNFKQGFFIYYEKKEKGELNYILNDVLCKKSIKLYYKNQTICIINYFYLNRTDCLTVPSELNLNPSVYGIINDFGYIKDYRTKSKHYGKVVTLNGNNFGTINVLNDDNDINGSVKHDNGDMYNTVSFTPSPKSCPNPLTAINSILNPPLKNMTDC
ncbi:hypothetical protein K502DRAFT_368137 [Neoconidiobolus thromboides FSU 785]|nr:hypothetical protein K502DRAFT_368137 [Neoconidiobolus thromboides FSU 785]